MDTPPPPLSQSVDDRVPPSPNLRSGSGTAVMRSICILNIPTGYQKQTLIYRFFTRALQNTLERLKNCRLAKRVGSATDIIMVLKTVCCYKDQRQIEP